MVPGPAAVPLLPLVAPYHLLQHVAASICSTEVLRTPAAVYETTVLMQGPPHLVIFFKKCFLQRERERVSRTVAKQDADLLIQ